MSGSLMQDGYANRANRWPETTGAVTQNGAVGADKPGTVPDTQQLTQTLSTNTRQGCAQQLVAGTANRTAAREGEER